MKCLMVGLMCCVFASLGTAAELSTAAVKPFGVSLNHRYVPKYAAGSVFLIDDPRQSVNQYDTSGNLLRTLAIPGASNVQVSDVAGSRHGNIAISFSSNDESGNLAAAIAWFNAEGLLQRVVRTSPYSAKYIVFADDETLWGAGRVYDQSLNTVPGAEVLRHYDIAGRLIGTAVANSTFKNPTDLPTRVGFLSTAKGRVIFYSRYQDELIELSNDGNIIGRYAVAPLPASHLVTGMAASDDGGVYMSASPRSGGSGLYHFDRATGHLVPVDAAGSFFIIGGDNGQIVVCSVLAHSLTWLRP